MFKKKPAIKSLSPLKSSERRRTADSIIKDFQLAVTSNFSTDDLESKAAATAAHTALRNSLLPENSLSARFTTTSGPDLKQVAGTVYAGSHSGVEQRILWVKIEEKLYPTVYTLWHNPGLVPLLHTPSFVVNKLKSGADLMTPGLARGPPFPSKAMKDAVVAVASIDVPSVPVAVGFCEIDVGSLQQVQGAKGHAVQIIHFDGDELWAWSPAGKPGLPTPESIEGWDSTNEVDVMQATQELKLNDEEAEESGGVAIENDTTASNTNTATETEKIHPENSDLSHDLEKELTTKEIDDTFRNAFLYGIHRQKQSNMSAPNHGLTFPLTQSFVMSNLVLPFLPTFTPKQTEMLGIKKTSWKNVRKFVKYLDKEKLVLSKDRDGNEVVILDIDFEDQVFTSFVPYQLPRKDSGAEHRGEVSITSIISTCRHAVAVSFALQLDAFNYANTDNERFPQTSIAAGSGSSDSSIGQQLRKVDLHKPRGSLIPLFKHTGADSRYYTTGDVKAAIVTYIESENLISSTNKRLVQLDPHLSNALFSGESSIDKEVLAKGTCPRDALIDRVVQGCTAFHVILRGDDTVGRTKPKSGAAPKIQIVLETRSGNKTVTRIYGLETYFINPQLLADELRKACASSTSVEPFKGGKGMEVLVQGPQKDAVVKALTLRGVLKQWIESQDKRKSK